MADFLVEIGIAEQRALACQSGHVKAAAIYWPGALVCGQVEDAILVSRRSGSQRGTARFASGQEALVDRLPRNAQEGAIIRLEVTRAALAERGRYKRAHARPSDLAPVPAPDLAAQLGAEGHNAQIVHHFPDPQNWDMVWAQAWDRHLEFAGGALDIALAPAMTVIDVDGTLPPAQLAQAATPAVASALQHLALAGNIAIDFPTLAARDDRRKIDQALEVALAGWPHERTAMNGFGLVQIISRIRRASLPALLMNDPAGAAARHLLARAERITEPGALLLVCHPDVALRLSARWIASLERRSGRHVRIESRESLALDAGFAQAVVL
ncbi:MAG: ribonuclease [Sphingomonadaceae bacterium]